MVSVLFLFSLSHKILLWRSPGGLGEETAAAGGIEKGAEPDTRGDALKCPQRVVLVKISR